MPRFLNAAGDYCAGEGLAGDRGVTSINGNVVLGPGTSGTRALNDAEAICQLNGQLLAVDAHGRTRVVDTQGANELFAGGNVWAAKLDLDHVSTYRVGRHGSITPSALPIIGVGLDGSIATKADHAAGLVISGHHVTSSVVDDLNVFSPQTAIWREGFTLKSVGMPVPVDMPPIFYWFRCFKFQNQELWCCYQDGHRLCLRPFSSSQGYDFPSFLVYRPDLMELHGKARVVWSRGEGEQPGDIEVRDQDLTAPRVALNTVTTPPIPEPEPEPTRMYERRTPDYTAHVKTLSELFPAEWDRANKEKHGRRTDEFARLLASYLHFVVGDTLIGLNGKRGGDELSADVLSRKNDTGPGGVELIDFIIGGGHQPAWNDATIPPFPHPLWREDAPREGVLGKFIQPAPYVGTPVPVPTPSPEPCDCEALIKPLQELLTALVEDNVGLRELLVLVTRDVEALKLKPVPESFDPKQYQAKGTVDLFGLMRKTVTLPLEKK
jgi:hypothetical protein